MKAVRVLRGAAVALVIAGLAAPSTMFAAEQASSTDAAPAAARSRIVDAALDEDGVLNGVVVDGQGRIVPGETVTVTQGRREIARIETGHDGLFHAPGLRGGVYQISTSRGTGTFRVWTSQAAPVNARKLALVVNQSRELRGQEQLPLLGTTSYTQLATLAVSGALGGVALAEINDLQNTVDAILATVN